MGILEKLGLSRKKKGVSSLSFENKKKEDEVGVQSILKANGFKILVSIGFLGLILSFYPRTSIQDLTYRIGEPWRDDDVVAPFTFSELKDREEIQQEEEEIKRLTPPIFHIDHRAEIRIENRLDSLFKNIQPVVESYAEWQISKEAESSAVTQDSIRYINERNRSGVGLDENGWRALLENYAAIEIARIRGERPPTSRFIGTDIRLRLESLIDQILRDGIINISKDQLNLTEITVRNLRERTERSFNVASVREAREARDFARIQLNRSLEDGPATSAYQLFSLIIEPNLIYREDETQARIDEAIQDISQTKGAVVSGQVIIRRGDLVTPEKHRILQSLAVARADRASDMDRWQRIVGESLIVIAIFLSFFMYIYLYRRQIYNVDSMFLLVFLIHALVLLSAAFIARFDTVSIYLAPLAIAPVILTIIFDSRVGLMTSMTVALIAGLMFGNNFEYIIATFTACSMGVYSVRDIKNRGQFYITTPALVFFTYMFVLFGFTLTKVGAWDSFIDNSIYVAINAIAIWLTYPLILLIEKIFKVTTDVTLLELSDTNRPILKRMMTEAPGSFHHSLQVAGLTEAAASAIGANALLARVGALYHDIGKLQKPLYFVENQEGRNEHDNLKPRMSALIIQEHVSAGVQMAKDLDLPEVLINFIRTHHGTSLIEYFYDKAKRNAKNENEIQVEDFRYEGPLPNTKETGILLLADSIEAASRSMPEKTYNKLDNLVERLVDKRVEDGQLNDCSLTFQDINIIKQTFMKILTGMYHARVKYPNQDKDEAAQDKKVEQQEADQEKSDSQK